MKILKLKPRYFRGFVDSDWIDLSNELVLVFGPNGSGKTSMSEAVEWLLLGATARRRRGDSYSKTEYVGSYRNVHAPDGEPTEVVAWVRFPDQTTHELKRVLTPDKNGGDLNSTTYVDGVLTDFNLLGIPSEFSDSPVIAQHGLQDFIHTTPKERRDWISGVLGLDPLVELKTELEGLRVSLRTSPPTRVREAQGHIKNALTRVASTDLLEELAQRWAVAKFDLFKDYSDIKQSCLDYLNKPESRDMTWSEALQLLVEARVAASKSVFDTDLLRPREDVSYILESIKATAGRALVISDELKRAVSDYLSVAGARYSQTLLSLWQTGLDLVGSESDMCPLCEAETFTQDIRSSLRERLTDNATFIKTASDVTAHAGAVVRELSSLVEIFGALRPPLLEASERASLSSVCHNDQHVDEFLAICAEARTNYETIVSVLLDLRKAVTAIPTTIGNPHSATVVSETMARLGSFLSAGASEFIKIAAQHRQAWEAFRPTLEANVSAESTVRNADALIALLGVIQHVSTVSIYQAHMDDLLADVHFVEKHLKVKQQEVFSAKGQEIKEWYDLMNPGTDVGYRGMEPATNAVRLLAESFSTVMSAPACLSQSQLNCLGLSVRFMRATSHDTDLRFLIVDDPVQSMDDDHTETFIARVIPKLLQDHGLQVIILSHLRGFVDRIREVNLDRLPLMYAVEGYTQAGPVISQYSLDKEFANLRAQAKMNEEQRRIATTNLRVLTERILREAHLRITGSPMNQTLDDAGAKALLTEFAKLAKLSQSELSGLTDTVNFSSPSHHAEVGWQVPSTSHLTPHIDRLVTLSKKLGLM